MKKSLKGLKGHLILRYLPVGLIELYAMTESEFFGNWLSEKAGSCILIIILAGVSFVFEKYTRLECRKAGIGFGFFGAMLFITGKWVKEGTGDYFYGLCFLGIMCFSGKVFSILYQFLENADSRTGTGKNKRAYNFLKVYLIMILCYFICFLAYFPGCMSYDSYYITLQALRLIGFDNHHPFLHTLIWSIFISLENLLKIEHAGIILYTCLQVLAVTAVYSNVIVWISRRAENALARRAAFLYYAINPVFHIFALLLTKDVLFSAFFLLFNVTLVEFFENMAHGKEDKEQQNRIIILGLINCLLRNNMVYVLLVFCGMLITVFKRRLREIRSLLLVIVLYYFVTGIIYPSVGVAEGSRKEMLSVPMSQIASVYQTHLTELEATDQELIRKYIPDVDSYDRFFADYIKMNFNEKAFREDTGEFFSLWARLFFAYPIEYVKAFLALNLPSWYPQMNSAREYIETGNYSSEYQIQRTNLLPDIYGWYEDISENRAGWMHWPVICLIFSIGTPIWIILFFARWFVVCKKKEKVLAILPIVLLWMTYLLGPVSNFRYMEPIMITYPIWFTISLERNVSR